MTVLLGILIGVVGMLAIAFLTPKARAAIKTLADAAGLAQQLKSLAEMYQELLTQANALAGEVNRMASENAVLQAENDRFTGGHTDHHDDAGYA